MNLGFPNAYLLTLLLETPVYWYFLRKYCPAWKAVAFSIIINAITLPFVWFVFYPAIQDYWTFFAAAELFAFIAEAVLVMLLIPKTTARKAFLASLAANAASATVGLALAFLL